jgi:CubicO group peptidase (beta-lactamase class C family)
VVFSSVVRFHPERGPRPAEQARVSALSAALRTSQNLCDEVLVAQTRHRATEPAQRPITFEDLLTHRSGLTYGPFHDGPIARAYEVLGGDIDTDLAPDPWIGHLASLPLIAQPGAVMHYGHSTDLLGLLLARMESTSLGELLQRRILGPLGMVDTGFTVPRAKAHRQAAPCGFDEAGRLTTLHTCPGGSTMPARSEGAAFESGGQGLWSTLDDYLKFARLFIGGGVVDGVRLLRPETTALMTTNVLNERQRARSDVGGARLFASGHGFGLGVAIVLEPPSAEPAVCGGHVGSVGWPGGFGGWWRSDREDQSVAIFLSHTMVERAQLAQGIGFAVYEAITEFQALALMH